MGLWLPIASTGNPAGGATSAPTPPSGHPGIEFAELVTAFTAQAGVGPTGTPNGINIDIAAMGAPKFNYTLGWTNPTGVQPWMRNPFGGVAFYVSFYGMSPLPNGPVPPSHAGYPIAAVTSGAGQNIWPFDEIFASSSVPNSLNQLGQGGTPLEDGESYDLIIWAVSMDSDGNQNSFDAAVTPNLEITWTWPLGSAPTAAIYTDNVSSFALGTPSYVVNGAGQKVLRIPYSCTLPTDARFGGFTITYSKGVSGTISIAVPVTLAASGNIDLPVPQPSDLTGGNVPWYFYPVAQDTNGNLNSSLTIAPVSGTPFATVTPPAPTGGSGVEQTSLVTGVTLSQSLIVDSNGVQSRFISATYTTPNDTTFGGVQLRIYNSATHNASTLVGVQNMPSQGLAASGFVQLVLPDPTSSVTWSWDLVSYSVNNNFNTEQSGTPHGTFTAGGGAGLNGNYVQGLTIGTAAIANAAIVDAKIASMNVSKLLAGTATVAIKFQVGGTGVITDVTQTYDATFGANPGVTVLSSTSAARSVMTPGTVGIAGAGNLLLAALASNTGGAGDMFLYNFNGNPTVWARGSYRITTPLSAWAQYATLILFDDTTQRLQITAYDRAAAASNASIAFNDASGATWFAARCATNGLKVVAGSGLFSGGAATVATGLSTVVGFSVTCGPAAEYAYLSASPSGGSVPIKSNNPSSTTAFTYVAVGT